MLRASSLDFDFADLRVRVEHKSDLYLALYDSLGYESWDESRRYLPVSSSSFVAEAFSTKKIVAIDDVQEIEKPRVFHIGRMRQYGLHSAIAAPLVGLNGDALGSIAFYRKKITPFSKRDTALVDGIAGKISAEINRHGLTFTPDKWSSPFSQALGVTDRFVEMSKRAFDFTKTTSFWETADLVVHHLCDLVCPTEKKDVASWISFYDDGSKYLAIPAKHAHCGVDLSFVSEFRLDNLEADDRLFSKSHTFNYYDISTQETEIPPDLLTALKKAGIYSIMAYPLLSGEIKPHGVLWIGRKSPFRFSVFDEAIFHNFADLAAIDLRNDRLYERQRFIARLKFPRDQFPTLQLLMEEVAFQAHEEFNAHFATFILGNGSNNIPDSVASTHPHTPSEKIAQQKLADKITYKLWDQLMESDSGIIAIDCLPDRPELYGEFTQENYIQSLLAIRVDASKEPLGVLILNFQAPRQFENRAQGQLRELADAAGIAIRNYQLTETLQFLAREKTRQNVRRQFREDLHDTRNIFQTRVMLPLDHLHDRMVEAGLDDFSDELLRIIGQARASDMRYKSIQESMRDPTLVNEGLIVALGKLETEYDYIQPNLKIEVDVLGDDVPPAYLDYSLYRIATEAINNAARHGGTNVLLKMTLTTSQTDTLLIIEDNGRGFKYNGRETEGLGLTTMRHRASEIRATLDIQSQVGYGTTITVNAPHRHTTEDKFLDE